MDSEAQLLGSLKARAEDIVGRLQEIQFGIERNNLQWPEVLELFAVLSGQFANLNKELRGGSERDEPNKKLFSSIIHPLNIVPQDPNQIPELLRTKTEPEIENDEMAILEHFDSTTPNITDKARAGLLKDRIERYNDLVDSSVESYELLQEQLNLKTKYDLVTMENHIAAIRTYLLAINNGTGLRPAPAPTVVPAKVEEKPQVVTAPPRVPTFPPTTSANPAISVPRQASLNITQSQQDSIKQAQQTKLGIPGTNIIQQAPINTASLGVTGNGIRIPTSAGPVNYNRPTFTTNTGQNVLINGNRIQVPTNMPNTGMTFTTTQMGSNQKLTLTPFQLQQLQQKQMQMQGNVPRNQ